VGIIFAILTILLFGSWAVPTKTLKIDPRVLAFWLTVGHFLLSVIIFGFVAQRIPYNELIGPLIAGILWAVGIISGYVGIKHLGITRAMGIWIPTVIIVSALWGLIFFGEAATLGTVRLVQTIFAICLLTTAALAVILSTRGEGKLGHIKIGILASVILGILHGSFFVPLRITTLPIFVTFLPLTIGMIVTTTLIILSQKLKIKYDSISVFRMIAAGLILGGGNYTALLTIQFLGVARGYPLTQLGIIVNTLWGALVFKEIITSRGKVLIGVGIIIAIIGALILNLARV
jgi:glucose uptake protein